MMALRAGLVLNTETSPNASIHTVTIVTKAIVNGRSLRSSITLLSYRGLPNRDIAASPDPAAVSAVRSILSAIRP